MATSNKAGCGGGGGGGGKGAGGKVIATEKEPHKVARARCHWAAAAPGEVEPWIELREGDLRETLRHDLPEQVDFVLLDSKYKPLPPTR